MARYETDGSSAMAPQEEESPFLHLVKNEMSPDLPGKEGVSPDGSRKKDQKVVDYNEARRQMLGKERSAAEGVSGDNSGGISGARNSEAVSPVNYTGKGKNKGGKNKKGKGKGFFKKKGAVGFLIALFVGVGGVVMGSQSMMPFSLLAQFQETFDSIKVSNEVRSKTMWTKQLDNDEIKDPIRKRYFGFGGNKFKISSRQKSNLKKQGIYVVDDFGDSGRKAMLFDDGSGKLKIIAAGDGDIAKFQGIDTSKIDVAGLDSKVDLSHMEIDTDNMMTFRTAFDEVPDFRNGYIKSSRTWRGSVGAWFDSITVRFLQSNKLTRNLFKKYQERVKSEEAGNTRSAAKKQVTDIMEKQGTSDSELSTTTRRHDGEEVDELDDEGNATGKKTYKEEIETDTNSVKTKGATKQEIKQKMNEIKNSKVGKASSAASAIANVACTVFDVIGAINLLIVAQESIQIIKVVTSYFEAIDKVKAGDGEESPIHVLSEALTTPKATTIFENETDNTETLKNNEDVDVNEVVAEGKENTTAMQSEGISALYNGTAASPNDASVQNFNIGSRFSTIMGALGNSAASFTACAVAKAAAAVAGAVTDAVAIVGCVLSFGIGCVVDALAEAGISLAGSIAVGVAATLAINIITPLAVKAFTRDLISDLAGEDLGNAITSGANIYMGNNHLQGGGSLASYDKYVAYAQQQQTVIAEEARYERETRSPFDATSPYTFMGNLVKQVAAMYTIKSPIFGGLGTMSTMVSNSVVALLPSASAYDISKTVKPADDEEFSRNCPYLSSIGAVGDAFCNPYMITDMSTIGNDPYDVVDRVKDKNLDDNGNIKKGSNLANYISYCSQRSSAFGVADSNIAGNFSSADVDTGNSTGNTVVNGAIGAIPIAGDVVDLVNNLNQLHNSGWITGQSCVASDEELQAGGELLGVSWSENKDYQRFVEDQRYLESVDPSYESVVTAYLNEYYEENPLDNTYEGVLARKTGMTKDEVVAYLEIIEEWDAIAKYDPSTRYWMGEKKLEEKRLVFEDDNVALNKQLYIVLNPLVVWEWRDRNFAVA